MAGNLYLSGPQVDMHRRRGVYLHAEASAYPDWHTTNAGTHVPTAETLLDTGS